MNVALRKAWTVEQFLDWADGQEERFEFDGERPVAMTGGNQNHNRITLNIAMALHPILRGGPFRVHGPDMGIRTTGKRVRYPDVLINGTSFPGTDRLAPDPVVVFEVVSPSSGGTDRIPKVLEYWAVPSIQYYVILESDLAGLQILRRKDGAEGWVIAVLGAEDTLVIEALGIATPVSAFYEDVTFAIEQDP